MTEYVRFIEHNEWEGETWHFWIPLAGNKDALETLDRIIDVADMGDSYEIDPEPVPEHDVDVLVAGGGDTDYMAAHHKLAGTLTVPDTLLSDPDNDELYKGGIRDLMSLAAQVS